MSSLIVKVREVNRVKDHPNADRLEVVKVAGWDCIVPIGKYSPGDLVIFIPPDCLLPRDFIERFDIIYLKGKHGRTGVVKLRGVHSYGIVVDNLDDLPKGMDVAAYYGIEKWEPPKPPSPGGDGKRRKRRGQVQRYHNFFKYTDIENIRNFPGALEDGEEVVITEKIHGTNFRVGYVKTQRPSWLQWLFGWLLPDYDFVVGSRNVELAPDDRTYFGKNIYMDIAREYNLKNRIPEGFVAYGEIYGPGIQDLTYGRGVHHVCFFDVMRDGVYLDYREARDLLTSWELPVVPELCIGPFSNEFVDTIVNGGLASALDDDTMMEGVVIKPTKERIDRTGQRVVFKSINPDYLTRKDGTEYK